MANCSVCHKVMSEWGEDNADGMHYACRKSMPVTIDQVPDGPGWVKDPSSPNGAIAFRLFGQLSSRTLTTGDKKWLWNVATAADSGAQPCGTRGTFVHASDGASRMAKKDRSIMTVFYLKEAKGSQKINIYGIGWHIGGKGSTSSYTAEWDDGSKTSFQLGNSANNAAPPPKKEQP